jgi:adenine deaminase
LSKSHTKRQIEDFEGVLASPETSFLTENVVRTWRNNNPNRRNNLEYFIKREQIKFPFVRKLTKAFNDAGVLLLLGTDASLPGCFPGQSAQVELIELHNAGLTRFQALATGTRNAYQFLSGKLGVKEKFGVIAKGYRADILLLKANPLENIENIKQIVGVMIRGKWFSTEELNRLRNKV